jgi:hypothetical protein
LDRNNRFGEIFDIEILTRNEEFLLVDNYIEIFFKTNKNFIKDLENDFIESTSEIKEYILGNIINDYDQSILEIRSYINSINELNQNILEETKNYIDSIKELNISNLSNQNNAEISVLENFNLFDGILRVANARILDKKIAANRIQQTIDVQQSNNFKDQITDYIANNMNIEIKSQNELKTDYKNINTFIYVSLLISLFVVLIIIYLLFFWNKIVFINK